MRLASREAQRLNHEFVGTEHVLLGLIAEGSGVAANVLRNLDVDLAEVRRQVEKVVRHGPDGEAVERDLPPTPRTAQVISLAVAEAENLNHNFVGTEHLLLGLVAVREGVAARVLKSLGVELDAARQEVLNLLGHNFAAPHVPAAPALPPLLTPEQLRDVHERVARLGEQGAAAMAEQDFEQAARCRREADTLKRLLAWYEWARARA